MSSAYNRLEQLNFALRDVIGSWMDEGTLHVRPDFAAIGELWSFVDSVELEAGTLEREAAELREWLGQLESMRADAALL